VDNEAGLASGHHDAPLSVQGRSEAQALGARYRATRLDGVYCSDLRRSWETAEIAFAGGGVTIHREPRLREVDYGEWTRQPRARVDLVLSEHVCAPFPAGESYTQAAARIHSFLADLRAQGNWRSILIVGHRATQYALEHWLRGVPLAEAVAAPWNWQPGWTYVFRTLPPLAILRGEQE
jgi:broad specificity phosphatase PhoE